jgi:hypothetical protein
MAHDRPISKQDLDAFTTDSIDRGDIADRDGDDLFRDDASMASLRGQSIPASATASN